MGIVKYSIPTKILVEEMFVENLGVVLGVVICLVVVVVHISCGILILSGDIVLAVLFHLLSCDALPGYTCALVAEDIDKFEGVILSLPSEGGVEGVEFTLGIADITAIVGV